MISTFTAFFDANVFFGSRLRSLILELANTGLFRARWSEDVHREWMEAVVKRSQGKITLEKLLPTRQAMDSAVLDCLVMNYEPLIDTLSLPDKDDRHVLAAAISCHASAIVTYNLKDFPEAELKKYGLHAKHPDEFLLDLYDLDPHLFLRAVDEDRRHYVDPPLSVDDYISSLEKAWVKRTAERLLEMKVVLISGETGTGD